MTTPGKKQAVVIAGGTGLIGTHLTEILKVRDFEVRLLSRKKTDSTFYWNPAKKEIDEKVFANAAYLINLSGAGIADKRWTEKRKKEITDSRVQSAQLLAETLKKNPHTIKAIINISAVGIYGNRGDELLTEESKHGKGFLTDVCLKWEKAAKQFEELNIRTVIVRTGIVLSVKGGALPELLKSFQFFTGAIIGNGKQFYSWIHIDDLCGIIMNALTDEKITGVYNGVAPQPVTNETLIRTIGKFKKAFIFLKIPAAILKLMLSQSATMVLDSTRVCCEKIEKAGYTFMYPELQDALKNLIVQR